MHRTRFRQLNVYATFRQWRNRVKSIMWYVINRQMNRSHVSMLKNLAHRGSLDTVDIYDDEIASPKTNHISMYARFNTCNVKLLVS